MKAHEKLAALLAKRMNVNSKVADAMALRMAQSQRLRAICESVPQSKINQENLHHGSRS